MKIKNNKITKLVLMTIAILLLNGVIIYNTFFKGTPISAIQKPSDDPAEMADRASAGSYIEINTRADFYQPATR